MNSYVFVDRLLSPARIQKWIDKAGELGWDEGTTFGNDPEYRKTLVSFVPIESNEDTRAIRDFGLAAAKILGIDVRPQGPDNLQFACYRAGDFYKVHSDDAIQHNEAHEIRKISVALTLTDNPTIILEGVEMPPMRAGSALAFPSFRDHRVDACDQRRFSLVGWFPGPEWR